MTDQKLVDELEKALRDEAYDGGFGYMGDEQFTAYVRTLAETAAEVVEKALTPTDDEREAVRLRAALEDVWSTIQRDVRVLANLDPGELGGIVARALESSRSEVPEPMEEADAAFSRRLVAHDAEVRAQVVAEEPEWEDES